jgi:hypothetical protein
MSWNHRPSSPPKGLCGPICEVSVPGRHIGSGTWATLSGRGFSSWATLAPVGPPHPIRGFRARWFLAVDDLVRGRTTASFIAILTA